MVIVGRETGPSLRSAMAEVSGSGVDVLTPLFQQVCPPPSSEFLGAVVERRRPVLHLFPIDVVP